MSRGFMLRTAAWIGIIALAISCVSGLSASEAEGKQRVISAKLRRILTSEKTPGRILVTICLTNESQSARDLIAVAEADKTSGKQVFNPIKIVWYLLEKPVGDEFSALQQTTTIGVGENSEFSFLIKRPEHPGKYRLIVTLDPLIGTVNDALPAGFSCEAEVVIGKSDVTVVPPDQPSPHSIPKG